MAKLEFKDKEYERFIIAFTQRLELRRKALGLSQNELAKKLGCSKTHICNVENGYTKISAYQLMKWCSILNISPSDALGYRSDDEMMLLIERIRALSPSQFRVVFDMVREFKDLNEKASKKSKFNFH